MTRESVNRMQTVKVNRNEPVGHVLEAETHEGGLRLRTEKEYILLRFFTSQMLNVYISRNNQAQPPFSYAVSLKPEVVSFEMAETSEAYILSTSDMRVWIGKKPLRISIYTPDGTLINEDDPAFGTSWLGQEVSTYKTLHPDEVFLGLGEKNGPLNRRGKAYVNWNTDHFAYATDDDPLYMSVPFYIGLKDRLPYGIYLDNTHRTTFNFGASGNRFAYFKADDGDMNYYIMVHPAISGIINLYTLLTGRMPLPPLWSLGFQQCRYSYYPDTEVLRLARTFREKQIPADVIYLDIHYMQDYRVFTWHPERFPDPLQLTKELEGMGFKLAVILDPGIKKEPGYRPFDQGNEGQLFVTYPDGEVYEGEVWPGWSCFPDFTREDTRKWWAENISVLTDKGVKGFWNDMNEPAAWGQHLPDLIEFSYEGEQVTHKKARNIYGMQMARATYEGARSRLSGERPFVLTRAGFSGIQRYAAAWTGDNVATDEHMLAGVRLINSLGLSGVAFAGMDVGGFAGEASSRLFARWMMIGAFSPLFRAHSMINSRDAEPWSFGEETEEISANFIRLRYRLMPYIYSVFYECSLTGMPVSRALPLAYPDDKAVYREKYQHQFLFGPFIMVVACESTAEFARTHLPAGKWYNLFSNALYEGPGEFVLEAGKEKIPVLVKAGAVIPEQSLVESLQHKPKNELKLHIYAGGVGEFDFYEDDGISYKYDKEAYYLRRIFNDFDKKQILLDPPAGKYPSKFNRIKFILHGFDKPGIIKCNGTDVQLSRENVEWLKPLSAFDPFSTGAEKQSDFAQAYTFVTDNTNDKIIVNWG